ncbi:MAG: hypothetical protein E3J86_12720 [Candidatus Thorarchaeota archaeon]|nr:MAG: hypothetical protein E3J86_12720 [Candidatus Thorarchaeota archaeon]
MLDADLLSLIEIRTNKRSNVYSSLGGNMGKVSVECPRCGKKVKANWDDKKPWVLKEVKGAPWYTLLKQEDQNQWIEDWREGIGVHCKCGKVYFVYDVAEEMKTSTDLQKDFSVAVFCDNCRMAFMNAELECPTCNQHFA